METTFIYTLSDPRTNLVRYVGKSNRPIARVSEHISDGKRTYKANWLRQLKKLNLRPTMEILDEVSQDEWKFWECYWISQFRTWGFPLTNMTDGGEGFSDPTGELRKRISKKHLGRKQKQSTKDKRIETRRQTTKLTGRWAKDGTYDKVKATRLANGSYKHSDDTKIKMSHSAKEAFKKGTRQLGGGALLPPRFGKDNPGSRAILQYDLDGSFLREWPCLKQAAESLGKDKSGIWKCCTGKTYSAYKFIWLYKNPEADQPNDAMQVLANRQQAKANAVKRIRPSV